MTRDGSSAEKFTFGVQQV